MEFNHLSKRFRGAGILALALLFASGVAWGQAQTGNVFVHVTDEQGVALPGVGVTLSGVGAPVTQVTNAAGDARFLSLSPGSSYVLDFALSGFAKVDRKNVIVAVNQNTEIKTTMKLSAVQEQVVVTAESPLLDTRKTGSQTQISAVELAQVPTSRDPWVVLQTAPGVQLDRVNVGGSESGQQPVYIAKGTVNQSTWNVDGVNITDMAAQTSPSYYDFDTFAEMNVSVGGADASIETAGGQFNLVTKRGTNDVHGSGRMYYETKKTSATNVTAEELAQQVNLGLKTASGNTVDKLQDYGLEMGGPVIKDMLWLWGSYNLNQINLITAGGVSDKTTLENFGFKLNFQPVPENNFSAQYMNNNKLKFGRNASPSRPQETTFDQSGPTKIYKLEDSHIFSPDLFATVTYARVMSGFGFVPEGGNVQVYEDSNSVYHNSFYYYTTIRNQTQLSVNPSFFFRTGSIGHELKAGFTYRTTPVSSTTVWPTGVMAFDPNASFTGLPIAVAAFARNGVALTDQKTYAGFVSDTLTAGKLTVNVGVRYDYQQGQNVPFSDPIGYNPTIWPQPPLQSLNVPGTPALTWKDFSPRIGVTYQIDDKTLGRLSYGRFIDYMGSANVAFNSPAPGSTYLYYPWTDANGNHKVDPGEVNFSNGPYSYYNWDPTCPNCVSQSINKIASNLKAPHTDEFLLSFEREVMPAFVVSATGTYRRYSDVIWYQRLDQNGNVMTPADFTCSQQGPYVVPGKGPEYITVCNPLPGVAGYGREERNRPGYYQQYVGVDLSAMKRYSDKWMARFNFTYNNWTQHGLAEGQADPSDLVGGSEQEGGPVLVQSTGSGSKGFVYLNSKWQGTLTGLYTLPLDFNLSTNVIARQGYAAPYYVTVATKNTPGLSSKNYQLGSPDDVRLPAVLEWDMGLAKPVKVGPLTATLQVDCFNILNRGTELQRQLRVRSTPTIPYAKDNYVYEIQSPRIFRFGARIAW